MDFFKRFLTEEQIEAKISELKKYQKYVYTIIIIVVCVQLFFIFVQPKIKAHKIKKQELTRFRKIFKTKSAKALDKENIEKEIKKLNKILDSKKTYLCTQNEFNNLYINQLTQITNQSGLKTSSIKISDPIFIDSLRIIKTDISVNGPFFNLINFFDMLESYPKIIKIINFSINTSDKATKRNPVLSAIVSLQVYIE
jgi:Tfp pilus assembly protein PilO